MRSLRRFSWLAALLCVALLATSLSTVRCYNEEKSSDLSSEQEDLFDGEMLDGLDYDSIDESENEYGAQAPATLPAPQQTSQYQTPTTYSQPQSSPPSTYSQPPPSYSPPPPPPSYSQPPRVYAQPVAYNQAPPMYSQPQYNPMPVPNYTAPIEYQTQPAYQAPPTPVYESLVPAYQPVEAPIVANYTYQKIQPVVYETVSYMPTVTSNYSQPKPVVVVPPPQAQVHQPVLMPIAQQAPAPTYQQAPAPTYQQTPASTYKQAPAVTYQQQPTAAYQQAPTANYQPQPIAYQASTPAPTTYQQPPVYQKPAMQQQQNYSNQIVSYEQPKQQPIQYKPMQPMQPMQPAHKQPMQQWATALTQKYSAAELAPLISPFGYRSNHWSLFYYRGAQNPYFQRQCPKNPYVQGPSYKDIEHAFIEALGQLGQYQHPVYSNASHPSFAARHQIFSLLSQQSARMDEEGLLVELVSRHLADRFCLTKWDKQRYLPQLTKFVSSSHFPPHHSCSVYYRNLRHDQSKHCYNMKYRTYDGFCNNPYHPYWGKADVCHIRLLSPDYADGVSLPRESINQRYPLPNPRQISNIIHTDIAIDGPYNLMKMQWGQFMNHDITNTALSAYDGLVDCCRQPQARGCWPILIPPGDRFYGERNVTCLNFIRSGVCPLCQLGPRQQWNKNTAFIDLSQVYGNKDVQAVKLRTGQGGQLRTSTNQMGEQLLPMASTHEQCFGSCYEAGDTRVNQHPALTALHVLLLRNHNYHAQKIARQHLDWPDEIIYQEARRINIAEYQMITFNEYFPLVFGPILSAYYNLLPLRSGYTMYNHQVDPTTWNEYSTATCRFGHSQISSTFGLYSQVLGYGQADAGQSSYRLKDWYMRPSLLNDGQLMPMVKGLLAKPAQTVDPWVTNDVRNHLYQSHREHSGGDLAATNVWRGRDHGIPGYVHYVEYCFNHKVRGWRDLALFIPPTALNQLRRLYRVVENIDLFTGGLAERHFPGADIGPTFACINGIQYYHLKFGDRYYFEHGGQAGSFTPPQLDEIRRSTLARLVCRTTQIPSVPLFAFLAPSLYNPLVNCSQIGDFNHAAF